MKLAPFYLIALSLIGLADAAYLSYYAFTGSLPSCAIGGCGEVLTSSYSKLAGMPLAYWGVLFYLAMLALSGALAVRPAGRLVRLAVLGWAAIGFLCSLAFIYIQGVLIGHYCMYCLISAAATVFLFAVAVWHFLTTRRGLAEEKTLS